MRVICIDDSKGVNKNFKGPYPKFGEPYNVLRDCEDFPDCYVLAEFGDGYSYSKRRFAPLSDISEESFTRNYNTQNA